MNIAVVGGGIFSWAFLREFSRLISVQRSQSQQQCLQINMYDGSLAKSPCSYNSTALVARRAGSYGISPLGDLIQNSWNWWIHHYVTMQLGEKQGVILAPLVYHQASHQKRLPYMESLPVSNFSFLKEGLHRVEPSFLIHPPVFIKYLKEEFKKNMKELSIAWNIHHTHIDSVDVNQNKIFEQQNVHQFDLLVIQPGAYKVNGLSLLEKEEVVYGSFLEFKDVENFSMRSFTYSSEYHLYYRLPQKSLQIGIFSSKETSEENEWKNLEQLYDNALQDGWRLPKFSLAHKITGARHKIKNRLPVIGQYQNCYYHLGGYKIGYLVSLYQAKKLAHMVLSAL